MGAALAAALEYEKSARTAQGRDRSARVGDRGEGGLGAPSGTVTPHAWRLQSGAMRRPQSRPYLLIWTLPAS